MNIYRILQMRTRNSHEAFSIDLSIRQFRKLQYISKTRSIYTNNLYHIIKLKFNQKKIGKVFLHIWKLEDILLKNSQVKTVTTVEIYWMIMKTQCIEACGMQQKWKFFHNFLSSRDIFSFKSV